MQHKLCLSLSVFSLDGPTKCQDCSTYAINCDESASSNAVTRCQCPSCPENSGTSKVVCGSDGKRYPSRCHLRRNSCEMDIEIFEVPMTECDPDYEPEGSGDSYFCQFGGEEDPRSDYFDDEEFLADCQCNWHCDSQGNVKNYIYFGIPCFTVRGILASTYISEIKIFAYIRK